MKEGIWKDDKRVNWVGEEPHIEEPIEIQINKVPIPTEKTERNKSKKIFSK